MLKYQPIELLSLLGKYHTMFRGTVYDEFVAPNFSLNALIDEDDEEGSDDEDDEGFK